MSYLINILFIITIITIIIVINLLINHVFIFHSTPSDPHPATDSFLDYVYFHRSNHLSFAVDTHPLLPMCTIFVTCLLGLLKIGCFLRVLNFSLQ